MHQAGERDVVNTWRIRLIRTYSIVVPGKYESAVRVFLQGFVASLRPAVLVACALYQYLSCCALHVTYGKCDGIVAVDLNVNVTQPKVFISCSAPCFTIHRSADDVFQFL